MEQRWNNICDIAAAREEEMKAIRSQLEGYEAEFGRVQTWLDTQENKLTSMRVCNCSPSYLLVSVALRGQLSET